MTTYDFTYLEKVSKAKKQVIITCLLSFVFLLFTNLSFSQVTSTIDVDSIKIGEQITYKIEIEADTTALVVFPEGQTFAPLEMIESYKIDTTKKDAKYNLIKKYGLTQFDSGKFTIPKQKIIIGDKTFFTDSLKVEVKEIVVDTTKQGLYDIKPIIEVKKSIGDWWKYLLIALLVIALVGFLLWWFIWRQKPLTEEEEIALLPPYDRAKLALQKLDNSGYLKNQEMKEYYSELTFIIRKYLDEKVYDRALESTTDELVSRLNLLKEGNQIELTKEDIRNIETILKRADLVKFAKSEPDIALAEIDRNTIDLELDHVKEALPEPTEEEKLLDQQYKEEQERKKKRKKMWLTGAIVLCLLVATYVGFGVKYGFGYVADTIIGDESKELLEGKWVNSEYGFPPLTISTPMVLKRKNFEIPEELKGKIKISAFGYELKDKLTIATITKVIAPQQPQEGDEQQDQQKLAELNQVTESYFKQFEAQGAKNIISNKEKFTTPNGAEGVKVFGTVDYPLGSGFVKGSFTLLIFTSDTITQQVVITYLKDDNYLNEIHERVLNSLELKPKEEK